jgi:hypothetical protein
MRKAVRPHDHGCMKPTLLLDAQESWGTEIGLLFPTQTVSNSGGGFRSAGIAGLNKLVRSRSRGDHYAEFGVGRGPLDGPGTSLMSRRVPKPPVENRPAASMPGLGQTLPSPTGFAIGEVRALDAVGTVMTQIPLAVRGVEAGACGT